MIDNIITYLVEILHRMVQSYWGSLFFLLFGIYFIRYSIRKPTTIANIRGWAAGIGGVIVGLLIIIFKLTGKI